MKTPLFSTPVTINYSLSVPKATSQFIKVRHIRLVVHMNAEMTGRVGIEDLKAGDSIRRMTKGLVAKEETGGKYLHEGLEP